MSMLAGSEPEVEMTESLMDNELESVKSTMGLTDELNGAQLEVNTI